MLKIKKDYLFLFIKALNKTEIKYYLAYSKFTSKEPESNYIRVFKIIYNQKEYNEEEILKTIKSSRVNFFVLKSNLYYHILKALRSYNSAIKPNVIGYIQNALIFLKKDMLDQAKAQLNIAELKAIKEEQVELLAEINNLRTLTFGLLYTKTNANESLNNFFIESENTIKNIQIIRKCQHYKYILGFNALRKKYAKTDAKTIYTKLNQIKLEKVSIIANIYHLEAMAYYHYGNQNFQQCEICWNNAIKLYEQNKYLLTRNIKQYIAILYNILYSLFQQKIFDNRISHLISKLNQSHLIIRNNAQLRNIIKNEIYQNTITIEIDYYLSTGRHKLALEKVKQCKIDLSNRNLIIKSKYARFILEVLFAQTHFMHKEYDTTLIHIISITERFKNTRVDYQCQTRVFSLIVHFEMKNYILLPRMIRAAIQYVKKRKKYSESMQLIVNYIKNEINTTNNRKARKENLTSLHKKFIGIIDKQDAFTKNFFILEWLESKMTNEQIDEILQKKTKKTIDT